MKTSYSNGVVDDGLRVLHVKGLRIAGSAHIFSKCAITSTKNHSLDTSVIPYPIAAHTQAVSYALGEIVS